MATERFANSAQTTLASPIDSSTPTISVATATPFPGLGNFRIRIDNELLLVTGVSGTTWTATRGAESTTAAAHSSGAAVVQVLTAAAMNALTAVSSDQTANTVLAGPSSGGDAAPAFRALVTADLPNNGVTDAKLRDSTAASVIGRSAGSSGDPADIAAALSSGAGLLAFTDTTDTVEWKQGAGVPVLDGGDVTLGNVPLAYGGTGAGLSGPGADRVLFWDESAGQMTWLTAGSGLSISGTTLTATGSGGTVTSVALTVPSFLSVSGSPVTTGGTLAVTLATQNANTLFAGPTSGGAAAPTYRALVTNDLPDNGVTYAKIQAVSATDKVLGRSSSGAGDVEEIACTAAGRALIDDADAAAQRATLGLGTLATQSGTFSGTSSGTNTGDQTITLTGDVAGSGTGSFAATIAAGRLRGYISGCILSRPSNTTVTTAVGTARDSTDAYMLYLSSALTKTLQSSGAWAAGDNQNGLDTGSRANSTWYHVYLISQAGGAGVDVLFSTSAASPTMPSGYTLKRRIGSVMTDGSGNIIAFSQNGDRFLWSVPVYDALVTGPGTSAVLTTMSVPGGVNVVWVGYFSTGHFGTAFDIFFSSPDQADSTPSSSYFTARLSGSTYLMTFYLEVLTNTSGQIRYRVDVSNSNVFVQLFTYGWIDNRGKDQ